MVKALGGLLKAGVLAVILALIFHNFTARFLLIWALRSTLGVPVEVERANVDLLNTRVRFEGIKIKNPEGFPHEALAQIPRLEIDYEVSSWRNLRFHVDDLRIECDEIRLTQQRDGRINFMALKIFSPSQNENSQPEGKHLLLHRVDFSLDHLTYARAEHPEFPALALNVELRHVTYENLGNLQTLFRKIYQDLVRSLGPDIWNPMPNVRSWPGGHEKPGFFGKSPAEIGNSL